MELDEFDPFFNYRATEYLLNNGYQSYLDWHDDLSWYPDGRDVSATSQTMLHLTAANIYPFFSDMMSLYDFTIYFPAVIGSLATIPMFLFLRTVSNNTIGLLGAGFFSVSLTILMRGNVGWFKSEPLGLFLGLTAMYLIILGLKKQSHLGIVLLGIGGMITAMGVSAWGGILFFVIPLLIWFFLLPKLKNYSPKFSIIGLSVMFAGFVLVSLFFERVVYTTSGLVTLAFLPPIIFLLYHKYLQKKLQYPAILLSFFIIVGLISAVIIGTGYIDTPNNRYLSVLLPIDFVDSPLAESVSEHQIPSFAHLIRGNAFMLLFAPMGVYALIKREIDDSHFLLIISLFGIYIGITMARLEIFMSFAFVIFSAVGIWSIYSRINKKLQEKKFQKIFLNTFLTLFFGVLIVYSVLDWYDQLERPAIILFGGALQDKTPTWIDGLEWIRTNTPPDSHIMAWWDYGYWIETKAERTTFMDNAAFRTDVIENYANILTAPPEEAIPKLKEIDADYVLVYFLGRQLPESDSLTNLGGGGDISKMQWILEIGGREPALYYDEIFLNRFFYHNTFYGLMIPFSPMDELGLYGYDPLKIEFLASQGVQLVYISEDVNSPPEDRSFDGLLIYRINDGPI